MNERTKNAMESIENRQMKMDDILPFSCTHCGGCCVPQEEILISPLDLFRLAKELGLTAEQFMDQYAECYIGESSRMPIVRVAPKGETRRCPLLKNNKCSVHAVKPSVCRLYPLGRSLHYEWDEQEKPDMEKSEVIYFHSGCFCGSQSGHQTVREWLEEFHLLEDESFFIRWSQVVAETSRFLRKLEKMVKRQDVMSMAWDMVCVILYTQYDIGKEFLTQFDRNVEELGKHIAVIERMEDEAYGRGI